MKKILLYSVIFLPYILFASSNKEFFLQGNAEFFKGNFVQARHYYEQIPHKSSVVWQNIGNCYFNETNFSKAILCWKRAEQNAGLFQYRQLLTYQQHALEKCHCLAENMLLWYGKYALLCLPAMLLYVLLLIAFIYLLVVCYQCINKENKACRKQSLFLTILSIFVLLLLLIMHKKITVQKEAVVMSPNVSLYAGPEMSFHQKTFLPQGCIVQLLQQQTNMSKVTCSYGNGWICTNDIEIV